MEEEILKTILTELSDEQKETVKTNAEILELVKKISTRSEFSVNVESNEDDAGLKEKIRALQMEVRSLSTLLHVAPKEFQYLRSSIDDMMSQFKQRISKTEKHIHYLSKPLLISIVLVIINIGLGIWIGQLHEYIYEREGKPFYRLVSPTIPNDSSQQKHIPVKIKTKSKT